MTTMRGSMGLGPSPAPDYRQPSHWWEQAACGDDYRFQKDEVNVSGNDLTAMRATCRACPVAAECLADTLRHRDPITVRSGWTGIERGHALHDGITLTPGGPDPTSGPVRSHQRWTPDEDAILVSGLGLAEIAERTQRTTDAVHERRRTLRRLAEAAS